jgi:hypothetical protein
MLLVVAALAVVVMSVLADAGVTARNRVQAQTAADAAALASLEGGRTAAAAMAAANGAVLVSWARVSAGDSAGDWGGGSVGGAGGGLGGYVVTVVVRRGDSTATARASNTP